MLIFLLLAMTIAINVENNVMARLGFDQGFLRIGLIAMVVTGLIMHRTLLLIVLVLFLSIGANMPAEFMLNFGINPDIFFGALVAIVLVPVAIRIFDL